MELAQPEETSQLTSSLDGVHVLDILLGGIGVVHAEITDAVKFMSDAKVEANALGMADVQVAVGLRRKARMDLRIFLLGDVGSDDVADEIRRRGSGVFQTHISRKG